VVGSGVLISEKCCWIAVILAVPVPEGTSTRMSLRTLKESTGAKVFVTADGPANVGDNEMLAPPGNVMVSSADPNPVPVAPPEMALAASLIKNPGPACTS
jgi:hypothetical protein